MKMLERNTDKRYDTKFACLDSIVPEDHLLRKIESKMDFEKVYEIVEHLYCEDNGRPAVDPVVLVKMSFIQHLYGIPSLRRTVAEINMNMAYRWFIGYDIDTPIPHFATISYAFATRFPSKVFEEIFAWILNTAVNRGFVKADTVFIDATHIKANANRNKKRKEQAKKTARVYDEQLRKEIDAERIAHDKKPLKDKDDDNSNPPFGGDKEIREITVSTTDPESGLFHKGEHKIEFAYTTHVACDKNNFILTCEVTPGNVHDSTVFDFVYDNTVALFPEASTVAVDAGYKTPWICKKVQDDGRNISTAYKRPMSKKGFFYPYDYVYDEYYDCVICPNDQVLPYVTTDRYGYRIFKSNPDVCKNCPKRQQCTESRNCQKVVTKHIWESYVDDAEHYRHSSEGKESYRLRSQTIERVFADAKEKHGMRYTLLKGLDRVRNWVRFKFAAINLKKLAMWA